MKGKPRAESKMDRVIRLYTECGGICYLCGEELGDAYSDLLKFYKQRFMVKKVSPRLKRSKININEDHIIPKARGGVNIKNNRMLVHATCNSVKGSMLYEEYLSKKEISLPA